MTYSTLMVHLGLGHTNRALLAVASNMAERGHARVVGVAGCQLMAMAYGGAFMTGDFVEINRKQIVSDISTAEAEFRDALKGLGKALDWRSSVSFETLAQFVAREARCTDIILTGIEANDPFAGESPHLNLGDLVMHAGRPVLIVPAEQTNANFDAAMVGWKDTRETRRAIFDSLPLLKSASRVTVAEIAVEEEIGSAQDRLKDVTNWLAEHNVRAEPITSVSSGDDSADLEAIAVKQGVQLMVAGAYGHSRLQEWVLGGVTRSLLRCPTRACLVSH